MGFQEAPADCSKQAKQCYDHKPRHEVAHQPHGTPLARLLPAKFDTQRHADCKRPMAAAGNMPDADTDLLSSAYSVWLRECDNWTVRKVYPGLGTRRRVGRMRRCISTTSTARMRSFPRGPVTNWASWWC